MEDVSNPAALAEKISNDLEPVEKSQTDAVHATMRHLLDFYQEEFPGLEGHYPLFCSDMLWEADGINSADWHQWWLVAGSPPPAQINASKSNDGDMANDLWNLQIPIHLATTIQA